MHTRLFAVMAVASGLSLVGCKKKDAKTEGSAPASGSAAAGASGGSAAPPAAPAAGGDLSMLAADSEIVLGVDWQALQASMPWKKLVLPQLMKAKEVVAIVTEIKNRCGIDLQTDPKKVSLGIKGVKEEIPDGAAVVHGLDKAKAMACPNKFEAEAAKEKVVIKIEGDVITASDSDGYGVALTFVGDRALFMIGHQMSPDRVKKAISGDGSLASSKTFMDMHGKLDANSTIWGLVHGKIIVEEIEGTFPAKPTAVFGTIALGDAVSASLRGRFETPAIASEVVAKMKPQVDGTAQMFDKAALATDGADVTLAVAAAGAKLEALLKLLD
jgi:hypothetical protein